jgi:hypothetical protein
LKQEKKRKEKREKEKGDQENFFSSFFLLFQTLSSFFNWIIKKGRKEVGQRRTRKKTRNLEETVV